jgi:hypothetical protein
MAKATGKKTIIYNGRVYKSGKDFDISEKDIEMFKKMGFDIREEIPEIPNDDGKLDGTDGDILKSVQSDDGGDKTDNPKVLINDDTKTNTPLMGGDGQAKVTVKSKATAKKPEQKQE